LQARSTHPPAAISTPVADTRKRFARLRSLPIGTWVASTLRRVTSPIHLPSDRSGPRNLLEGDCPMKLYDVAEGLNLHSVPLYSMIDAVGSEPTKRRVAREGR